VGYAGTADAQFDSVKTRRTGTAGIHNRKQSQALRKITRRDKQRNALLTDVGLGSSSFHSFGNDIINTLKEVEEEQGGGPLGRGGLLAEEEGGGHGCGEDFFEEEGASGAASSASASASASSLGGGKGSVRFSSETTGGMSPTQTSTSQQQQQQTQPARRPIDRGQSMSSLQASKHLISARHKKKKPKTRSAYDKKMQSAFGDKVCDMYYYVV
jgi:hypothetical protein